MASLALTLEFGGGMELLFGNVKTHKVTVPARLTNDQPTNIKALIGWIRDNLLQDKPELFISDGTVRPGILVLINDIDWELEGELDYELKDKDAIVFISTLHGG
ncbi:Ubiquitin- modifier 1 [Dimargaris xerosporica]|nr:Ubiquitin- modifier 1 [Dimargaris xerosporica]